MAHHPDFVRFSHAFQRQQFVAALELIDRLVAEMPREPWLRWHRAHCLEKLERFDEVAGAAEEALAIDPDFVPAIVKRVQFAGATAAAGEEDEADESQDVDANPERALRDAAQARERAAWVEAELRRALQLQPDHLEALRLLSTVLRQHPDGSGRREEADALLERALALAPDDLELLETRAGLRRSAAMRFDDGPDDADTIHTFGGLRYSRARLEDALADYERCFARSGHHRHAVRLGSLLHDLGRYEEALARFDEALARMPQDDPARAFVLETRARSENGGKGERDELARLLESALQEEVGAGDRTLQQDMAAQAVLGAARAIRAGRPVDEALASRLSEDPDTMLAANIAQQILNVAHEPPPGLVAAPPEEFPAYQRKLAERVAREVEPLGLRHVADGEARGMLPMLGQRVLIRFFSDDSGEIGLAAFALRPKWPGWIGFLLMLLTGQWKTHRMVECVSQFDDGILLSTQPESVSPFEYGGAVRIEKLPRGAGAAALLQRHLQRVAAHKAAFPVVTAMTADDLAGMERRWCEGQRVKRAYRASVGYVTEAELKRLLGAQHARFGEKVRQQLAAMAADYD